MSELKYSYSFHNEINSLEKSNNALEPESIKVKHIPWLSTAEHYYAEHIAISKLLEAYQLLLKKEVEDLRKMMEGVTETDEKIATTLGSINDSY